jgi:cell wall-associated NlpC family hydrolase
MRTVFIYAMLTCAACVPLGVQAESDDLDSFLNAHGFVDSSGQAGAQPAVPAAPLSRSAAPAPVTAHKSIAQRTSEMVVAAMGALGVPYRYGGNTFDSGFDCSGFVRAMVKQTLGLSLPRQAAQQAAATHSIPRTALQPGDLVFFNTQHRQFSHVGIYVGEHRFIHSPRTGAVVRIEDMRVNYWNRRFNGARRVLEKASNPPIQVTAVATSDQPNY